MCMHVHMHKDACIHTHTHVHTHVHMHTHAHAHTYTHVHIHRYMYIYLSTYQSIQLSIHTNTLCRHQGWRTVTEVTTTVTIASIKSTMRTTAKFRFSCMSPKYPTSHEFITNTCLYALHLCQRPMRGGGLGSSTIFKNLMSPTPRRKWYLTTGHRAH